MGLLHEKKRSNFRSVPHCILGKSVERREHVRCKNCRRLGKNHSRWGSWMRNRLHSICPYFAMFPETFAQKHIEKFTEPGDYVYDPFSGRGTTLLQALLMNRRAAASDINPVA